MTQHAFLKALLLAGALAGCATQPTPDVNTFAESTADNSFELFDRSLNSQALVLPVVHDQQTDGASCGAHALASVINYWQGPNTVTGNAMYAATPPADMRFGYSIAELLTLARTNRLLANGVRLDDAAIIRELEAGRPVLVPVRIPSVWVQSRTLVPGATRAPIVGLAATAFMQRVGRLSEFTNVAMVNHYVLVVGYEHETFVVVEPVMGFRTISFDRLERYRRPFGDAAIVFSGQQRRADVAPAEGYVRG